MSTEFHAVAAAAQFSRSLARRSFDAVIELPNAHEPRRQGDLSHWQIRFIDKGPGEMYPMCTCNLNRGCAKMLDE
jgi:hypothetical protein